MFTALINTIVLALLATSTSAAPAVRLRDSDSDTLVPNVQDYIQSAISTYLAGHGTTVSNFHAIANGWRSVDFAGSNIHSSTEMSNNAVVNLCDQIRNSTDPHGPGVKFSAQYIDFINKVADDNPASNTSSPAFTQASEQFHEAQTNLTNVNTALLKQYNAEGFGPVPNISDPNFVIYAMRDAEYQFAKAKLDAASGNYYKALNKAQGDNGWVFTAAENNIRPITLQGDGAVPGLTMQIGDRDVVPSYEIPTLNATIMAWQQGQSMAPFSWSSSASNGSSSGSTSSGSGGISFVWEDVSGSGSGRGSTTSSKSNTNVESFSVSFGGISLMAIELGTWFDGWKTADALRSPVDDVSKKAAPAFAQFFGTKEKPGPASAYKDQALVVFQPSYSIEFASTSDAKSYHDAAAGASICFLFICGGGSGGSSSNSTSWQEGSKIVTSNDSTGNAYIIGYTQVNYWDSGDES